MPTAIAISLLHKERPINSITGGKYRETNRIIDSKKATNFRDFENFTQDGAQFVDNRVGEVTAAMSMATTGFRLMARQQRTSRRSRSIFGHRRWIAVAVFIAVQLPAVVYAAEVPTDATSPLTMVVLLGVMALLPFALIMMTSFVKVAVVLSILRTAIGAQQVPPNQIITGLAIVLSVYIMAPVGQDMYTELRPHLDAYEAEELEIDIATIEGIVDDVGAPLREFLITHADEEDRQLLHQLAVEMHDDEQGEMLSSDDFLIIIPAFVVTELRIAFTIGFILFVPFIVVDLVVANVLLSLGMHMLSPTTISLPFKLLLFVLVDGWYLVVKGLILGYM